MVYLSNHLDAQRHIKFTEDAAAERGLHVFWLLVLNQVDQHTAILLMTSRVKGAKFNSTIKKLKKTKESSHKVQETSESEAID